MGSVEDDETVPTPLHLRTGAVLDQLLVRPHESLNASFTFTSPFPQQIGTIDSHARIIYYAICNFVPLIRTTPTEFIYTS
jgi:hypothetical protein